MSQPFNIRVYFEDTDAGGVVFYANYLKFYERARTEFLRDLGYEQDDLLQQNIVFVVRNIHVDFILAARFNEQLQVYTRIESIKKASLVFKQEIFCQREGQSRLINEAVVKMACVKADVLKPTPIPAPIAVSLQQQQQREQDS